MSDYLWWVRIISYIDQHSKDATTQTPKYPVYGFEFILDTEERQFETILPVKKGIPRVKGFFTYLRVICLEKIMTGCSNIWKH